MTADPVYDAELVPTTPAGEIARIDDVILPGTAERIVKAIPANTSRSYERAWKTFTDWCHENGRQPLPATPATLADYVAHLCDLDRAPSTIKHRMAVVSKKHRLAGYPKGTPDAEAANLVLRGHRVDRAEAGQRDKEAPPITRERLQQMTKACKDGTLADKRDRLLLVIGWAMAGRRSELAGLRIEDITIGSDDLDILIRKSKTDKDAQGETVNVPEGEHVDTDPVGLLNDWLTALRDHGIDTTRGPLFRSITKGRKLYQQREGVRKDGRPYRYAGITPHSINGIVQRAAQRAGLPNAHLYSAHSLRAGFATQAANDGIPQSHWARHGRWNPTSPVPAKYVRRADRKRDNPLRKMGL